MKEIKPWQGLLCLGIYILTEMRDEKGKQKTSLGYPQSLRKYPVLRLRKDVISRAVVELLKNVLYFHVLEK